jgi:hypothetical protein
MARVETNRLDQLNALLRDASSLMTALSRLLPEPESSGPDTGTIGRHAPESREPWAHAAASAYWDLYFGARTVARAMREAQGLKLPVFDDVYGEAALDIIRNTAPGAKDLVLRGAVHDLERWVTAARTVPDIDESEPWVALPRQDGKPVACPYCKTYALRMLKRKGEVRCFFPNCQDSDGNPTRARMEPGRMTGEERLIFGDGTTMGGGA